MRKRLFLLIFGGMFICSAQAFALVPSTSYLQTITFSPEFKIDSADPLSLLFTGLTTNLRDATLVFDAGAVTDGSFKIYGLKNFALISTYSNPVVGSAFHVGANTFSSTDETLDLIALNNAISGGTLGLNFQQFVGSTTLKSATLSGTVAPEPASMALVAAGLMGLPFVRRFRKSLR